MDVFKKNKLQPKKMDDKLQPTFLFYWWENDGILNLFILLNLGGYSKFRFRNPFFGSELEVNY